MPIYEFRCDHCKKKFSDLLSANADFSQIECPHCHSKSARKLVSRFTRARSEDDRMDSIADRLDSFGEPDSSQKMREMVRDMGKAMDEDCADEMEEMFEADMDGDLPEDE